MESIEEIYKDINFIINFNKLRSFNDEISKKLEKTYDIDFSLYKFQKIYSDLLSIKGDFEIYEEFKEEWTEDLNNSLLIKMNEFKNTIISFDKNDVDNAESFIMSISAGAGGQEAANWVSIVLRMYLKFFEKVGYNSNIAYLKTSNEHSSDCIDSVTIVVEGKGGYNLMKNDTGVHRLIRNSPYNAKGLRQTSFCAVDIFPKIDDSIKIDINESDLEIEIFKGSGPGGQNRNKVETAVRIKHKPTGIIGMSKSERSQHDNKSIAMDLLKSKLFQMEKKKQDDAIKTNYKNKSLNGFSSQIRTYTIDPYQQVKNERSGVVYNNIGQILDGDLLDVIMSDKILFAKEYFDYTLDKKI